MEIKVPGHSPNDVRVTVSGGTIKKEKYYYIVKPSRGAREITIGVAVLTRDSTVKMMGKEKFRVRSLPTPIPQLGGLRNTGLPAAKAAVVVAQTRLISTYGPGFGHNLKTRVADYRAKVVTADTVYIFKGQDGIISNELRQTMSTLKKDDLVVFYGIKGLIYLANDSLMQYLPSVVVPIR